MTLNFDPFHQEYLEKARAVYRMRSNSPEKNGSYHYALDALEEIARQSKNILLKYARQLESYAKDYEENGEARALFWQEKMKDNEQWVATMMDQFGTTLTPREVDLKQAANHREMAKVLREFAKTLPTYDDFQEYN